MENGRRAREMRKYRRTEILIILAIVAILALFFLILYLGKLHKRWDPNANQVSETTVDQDEQNWEKNHIEAVIDKAELMAAGYDFDGAVDYIKSDELYKKSLQLLEAAESISKRKDKMVAWGDVKNITHISVRPLVCDTTAAYNSGVNSEKVNQNYITTKEFEALLNELYERGYVLVSLHDIAYSKEYLEAGVAEETAESSETGEEVEITIATTEEETTVESTEETTPEETSETEESEEETTTAVIETIITETTAVDKKLLKKGKIMLPEGKTPIVLSEENICYSPEMANAGFASKLIVKKDGTVSCEDINGNVGDFDLVPILEKFISQHPDFSYRGARAVLGISGENGVFGYKTAGIYSKEADYEKNIADATTVANALKRTGYELAFNGYHYSNMGYGAIDDVSFENEFEVWEREVAPITGTTDIIIFPNGDDIGDWHYYSGSRYNYLKERGFVYFLNMNAVERAWNQILNYYMRQGRRMITARLIYKEMNGAQNFTDIMDAKDVYDNAHLPME